MKLYKDTRNAKVRRAKEIATALMILIEIPDEINDIDIPEIKYDNITSTKYKLLNWYDDQLLEWFDNINRVANNYNCHINPRKQDVKRLLHGMPLREVCRIFIDEYERGEVW
jgi:hypothetical protein